MYSLLLNPKGRIFSDIFIAKPFIPGNALGDIEYWIDVDRNQLDKIMKYFRMYSLRKNVTFKHIDSDKLSIVSLCTKKPFVGVEGNFVEKFHDDLPKAELDEYPDEKFTETLMVVDPRQNSLGLRMYTPTKFLEEELELKFPNYFKSDEDLSPNNRSNKNPSANSDISGNIDTQNKDQRKQKSQILKESMINSKLGESPEDALNQVHITNLHREVSKTLKMYRYPK
jgi:hypothetical protein